MAPSTQRLMVAFCAATSVFALSHEAPAGVILQMQATQSNTFNSGNHIISQSFTAIDSDLLTIGFALTGGPPPFDTMGGSFTITLLDGEGLTGPVIRTSTRNLPTLPEFNTPNPEIFDFDFSGVKLTVGNHYTARITGTNLDSGVYSNGFGDLYKGGVFYGDVAAVNQDATFRVVSTSSVPEPSSLALVGVTVLAALGWRLRTRFVAGVCTQTADN